MEEPLSNSEMEAFESGYTKGLAEMYSHLAEAKETIRRYAQHDDGCTHFVVQPTYRCTCGLNKHINILTQRW